MIHEGPRYIYSGVVVGNNVTIHQGVTLGLAQGRKKGVPTIGNNVWLGPFCIVVGAVHIGDGAMICGGAFVNFDVPNNAIVIGNPGVIHLSEKGSQDYIGNPVWSIRVQVCFLLYQEAWLVKPEVVARLTETVHQKGKRYFRKSRKAIN